MRWKPKMQLLCLSTILFSLCLIKLIFSSIKSCYHYTTTRILIEHTKKHLFIKLEPCLTRHVRGYCNVGVGRWCNGFLAKLPFNVKNNIIHRKNRKNFFIWRMISVCFKLLHCPNFPQILNRVSLRFVIQHFFNFVRV